VTTARQRPLARRAADLDWERVVAELDSTGVSPLGSLLEPVECDQIRDGFYDDSRYRSTVDMTRHRYGSGVYRYFAAPLPRLVDDLRHALWPRLLPVARDWAARRGTPAPWADSLDEWLALNHTQGQTRPTPLVLRYGPGDWNALHRDLYGELVFPLQVVVGLDRPDVDYGGGELVVVEQRPRAQSRATALRIPQGHGVVLTTQDRPAAGTRGWTRHAMRHGVSTVTWGQRHTLGIIFHDAA
jgi:hypothetical protein